MRLFRRRRDEDLVDEIDTHLSLLEEQYRKKGMSAGQARDAARRSFGGVLKTRQAYRAERRWSRLDGLLQDARFGLRVLVRDRAFALTAIVVLGVGIGVNNMQFTIIYTHTMRALPIPGAARMMMASFADQQGADRNLSYLEYRDLQASANLFDDLAALGPTTPVALGDQGRAPDRYLATYTTPNAFHALRIAPSIGRVFAEAETLADAPAVAMLSSEAWRDRYASDPNVVGKDVLINGEPTTVVGVIHDRAGFPSTAQVLLPITRAPGFPWMSATPG